MSELFDNAFFARLNRLKFAMHIRLDQGQSGNRKSSAKGSSVEFSDFREYLPGDDIRRIDWNVYGRLDKLVIKQFMEEKEAYYHIFIDSSASMAFGEQKKSDLELRLAAAFTWMVMQQLDRVEVLTFREGRLGRLSPVVGRSSFSRTLQELEQITFSGKTGISDAVRKANLNGRGICILLSDFLDPEGVDEAVRYLTYQRQEVLLISILAREEVAFEADGTVALTDMETGEEVRISMTRQTIGCYRQAMQAHQDALQKLAKRYGCRFLSVVSDEDIDKILFETLQQKGIFG